jgi:hypothetical protein
VPSLEEEEVTRPLLFPTSAVATSNTAALMFINGVDDEVLVVDVK